jgi:hypothetical protein
MPRSISIVRRKANLVDLTIRKRAGITGFRFGAAVNFDAAFTTFITVPNYGLKSPSVPDVGYVGDQFRDMVRFLFDPSDYVATAPALVDGAPFYLRVESRNPNGSFNPPEAMHLVLPPPVQPNRSFLIRGTVPAGASLANSLEIQLPTQCNDFEIQNDGGAPLFVAFEPTGAEYQVIPVTTAFRSFEQFTTSVSQVFLRGAGGSTTMSSVWTQRNNEMM